MKISIFLLIIALALIPLCKGVEVLAQYRANPAESTGNTIDTINSDTLPLPNTFTQPADTMYKPDIGLIPDTMFKGRAPGAPGIEPNVPAIVESLEQLQDTSKSKSDPAKPKKSPEVKEDTAKYHYISPDKGIGPIKELKLGPIDTSMVTKGEEIFKSQCTTCHMLDKKKIGPPLRSVTKDRPPEFIMNMILNTDEMEKKDPEVKKLIDQYGVYMSVLDISKDQARQILEYLRWAAQQPPDGQ